MRSLLLILSSQAYVILECSSVNIVLNSFTFPEVFHTKYNNTKQFLENVQSSHTYRDYYLGPLIRTYTRNDLNIFVSQ